MGSAGIGRGGGIVQSPTKVTIPQQRHYMLCQGKARQKDVGRACLRFFLLRRNSPPSHHCATILHRFLKIYLIMYGCYVKCVGVCRHNFLSSLFIWSSVLRTNVYKCIIESCIQCKEYVQLASQRYR